MAGVDGSVAVVSRQEQPGGYRRGDEAARYAGAATVDTVTDDGPPSGELVGDPGLVVLLGG
jgi:hypothetical protein